MEKMQKNRKTPMSHEAIYNIMHWLPLIVASLFLVKNVLGKNITGAITIGIVLAVYVTVLEILKRRNMSIYAREMVLTIALPILVFLISLNSGASYSDDFPMFLAIIGMSGMYLEPDFTKIQIVLADILFVIMYVLHPEKAGDLSQYILCLLIFTLAAVIYYLVIKRGNAFIEISKMRAEEAENLLQSIRSMGRELELDFTSSSEQIEAGTRGLQEGSVSIALGAGEVSESCDEVQIKMKESGEQLIALTQEVEKFEASMLDSQKNMEEMNSQVTTVGDMIVESEEMFQFMEEKMKQIAKIAKQINDISFNLTILSLNASVEAARAGEYGHGFSVVSNKMRELSENSDMFSEQVSEVVGELAKQVEQTAEKFAGSRVAMEESKETMEELQESFTRLTEQFAIMYENIEEQNQNRNYMDMIFNGLNGRVADMRSSSLQNQQAVETIVEAMDVYRENITRVVKNTQI